jgi:hypothetical protein
MIRGYDQFLDESYLLSGRAPLYHFTYAYYLNLILDSNKLSIGHTDALVKNIPKKFISFTRDKNLKIPEHREDIEFNTDRLLNDYKLISYDFYITNYIEDKTKSDPNRIKNVEFEEICLEDILNLNRYIARIEFLKINDPSFYLSLPYIKKYLNTYKNIEVIYNGKIQKF